MSLTSAEIQFNPWKHHLAFICNQLSNSPLLSPEAKKMQLETIKTINANFVDVYIGSLSVDEITQHITSQLNETNINNYDDFMLWLGQKGYQLTTLGDNSVWVVRKSEYKTAFVHIHPSRKPPLTCRIHGNAWKTVVGLLTLQPDYLRHFPTLPVVNLFRIEFLNLSPVKGTENLQRIMRVYDLVMTKITL